MAESNEAPRPAVAAPGADPPLAAVLGAYLGEVTAGKRAAILGDGSTSLGEQLAETTGRRVHVFDPDAARTAAAIAASRGGPGTVRHALLEGDAELGQGAFDVVVIPNLAELAASGAVDAKGAVELAERMLAPRGFAAIATPRFGGELDYLGLFDAVSARFEVVHMLGAAPFAGITVAAFGHTEEPAVAIDSSLTEGSEEPLAYLAIASHHPVRVDPYLVVQLPYAELVGAAEGAPDSAVATTRAPAADEGQLAELTARERAAREDAEARGRTVTALSAKVAELEASLAEATGRLRRDAATRAEAERLAEAAKRQADEAHARELDAVLERVGELEGELDAMRVEASKAIAVPAPVAVEEPAASPRQIQALEFQIGELRKALGEARAATDTFRDAAARVPTLEAERLRLERELAQARTAQESATADAAASEAAAEIAALEARLRERGERVAALESDLREAERIGRELVGELARAKASAISADGAALAARASRLEADLKQAEWTIEGLRQELGETHEASTDVARLEAALSRALAQTNARI